MFARLQPLVHFERCFAVDTIGDGGRGGSSLKMASVRDALDKEAPPWRKESKNKEKSRKRGVSCRGGAVIARMRVLCTCSCVFSLTQLRCTAPKSRRQLYIKKENSKIEARAVTVCRKATTTPKRNFHTFGDVIATRKKNCNR